MPIQIEKSTLCFESYREFSCDKAEINSHFGIFVDLLNQTCYNGNNKFWGYA